MKNNFRPFLFRLSPIITLTLFLGLSACAVGHKPDSIFDSTVNKNDITVRRVAIIPNRLPLTLQEPEMWREYNWNLLSDRFRNQGFDVADYQTTIDAAKQNNLPLEDTGSSEEKFAGVAKTLGADVLVMPYYGTNYHSSMFLIMNNSFYDSQVSLQFYSRKHNKFFYRSDSVGTNTFNTGAISLGGMIFSMVGAMNQNTNVSMLGALMAVGGLVYDAIQVSISAEKRWKWAFEPAIDGSLDAFFKVYGHNAEGETTIPPPSKSSYQEESTPSSDSGTLTVTAVPVKAEVMINGQEIGETPYTERLQSGEYLVKVTASGYKPQEKRVFIQSNRTLTIPFSLEKEKGEPEEENALPPDSGALTVTAAPVKAEVTINGQEMGATPYKETLQSGQYIVKVTARGYQPQEKKILIQSNRSLTIPFSLEKEKGEPEEGSTLPPDSGVLTVTATPIKAKVTINDQEMGETPYKETLQSGEYIVKITAKGYKPQEKRILIQSNRSLMLPFSLENDPGQAKPGSALPPPSGVLTVTATPVKAKVTINGRELGETPYAVRLRTGQYIVKVTAGDYKPQEKRILIELNRSLALPFSLGK